MKRMNKIIREQTGASLLEVLIALFLGGMVTAAVFEIYVTQHKNWNIQDDVVQIQQNARAAIDELTRFTRMAGHQLPLGLDGVEAFNSNPDTIIVNFSESGCMAPIEHDMANATSILRLDGHDLSCFRSGQLAYIFHPDSGGGEFFYITTIDSLTDQITHDTALSQAYSKDAIVMDLQRAKFFIDRSDTLHPNMMVQLPYRPAAVYAENIEDLQIRYIMKNGNLVDIPAIPTDVRAVEITLIGRSDRADQDLPDSESYRRRTYTSIVNLRNLDI